MNYIYIFALAAFLVACQPSSKTADAAQKMDYPQNPGAREVGTRQQVATVQTWTLTTGPLVVEHSTSGTVVPETQSSVAAGVSGIVRTINRKAGSWVAAGDVIIQLDDSQAQLQLKIAKANLDSARLSAGVDKDGQPNGASKATLQLKSAESAYSSAQKNFNSVKALYDIGGASASDLDNASAQLQTSAANLEVARAAVPQSSLSVESSHLQVQQAQLSVQYAAIRAPFAGQIAAVNVHPGEFVNANTGVFILASQRRVVNFAIPPADASKMTVKTVFTFNVQGQQTILKLENPPSAPVGGTVPLSAALNTSFVATYGTVGNVSYSQELASGVLVPIAAIESLENVRTIYVVKENKVKKARVTIMADSGTYAVVQGVSAGTEVVLNPPPGLIDGNAIKTVKKVSE